MLDGAKIHLQEGWKEIKVMAWYEPATSPSAERDQAQKASFAARLEGAEAFVEFFWAEGRRRGIEQAREIVIIGDGAPWIWNLVSGHFPKAVQIVDHFTTNKERMRYRKFCRRQLHIGSGIVEGACKHLVGQRQKGSGMIWSHKGAQAIASLRSAFLSYGREKDVDHALRAA